MQHAEVVEYASGLARDMMGELVENVATGLDTYSIRQPLGVGSQAQFTHTALRTMPMLLL